MLSNGSVFQWLVFTFTYKESFFRSIKYFLDVCLKSRKLGIDLSCSGKDISMCFMGPLSLLLLHLFNDVWVS